MNATIWFEIFLLADVFLIGIVTAIAAQHAMAQRRSSTRVVVTPEAPDSQQSVQLPASVKERLIEASKAHFKQALEHSATELQHELKSTTNQLNDQLEKLGREVFAHEMERYRLDMEQLRKRADGVIGGAQAEIVEQQAQLRLRLAEDMAAEEQRLREQLDAKLGDAVVAFLTETLGNEVDLGAQMPYIMAALENHKADITRGVSE